MRNGDLSNKVEPRCLLIFENALGYITDNKVWKKQHAKSRYNLEKCWELNDLVCRRLLWLFHRTDLRVELVTFLGDSFAESLGDWLDTEGIPVSAVWSTTIPQLARNIAYMPDLLMVYDPEPTRWLTWGSKGCYITEPTQIGSY